jgi:hypothetical protein
MGGGSRKYEDTATKMPTRIKKDRVQIRESGISPQQPSLRLTGCAHTYEEGVERGETKKK